eukprot:7333860-Ditylum_brightwellii.AAC.2
MAIIDVKDTIGSIIAARKNISILIDGNDQEEVDLNIVGAIVGSYSQDEDTLTLQQTLTEGEETLTLQQTLTEGDETLTKGEQDDD